MSKSLEDTLVSKQGGEGDEEEEDNKPKSAIIIPQKVMKSPLDVVNTYPSKFQNGTFKAHILEESDNEESDTPTNGSGSARHASYHKQSSSSSTSKQTHKKVEEARKAASQAKQELNLLKIKQDLQTLRTNELLAQLFHSMDTSYNSIVQDDSLKENFSVLLQVYLLQKDEYNKLMFPSSTQSAKIPTAHESVLEAEFLVEKTLENFEEEQEKSTENPLGLRVHASEITLKEKQLEHMQEQLDIEAKKSMSQSSLSDDYQSNSNQIAEEELATLKEQNQFLKISAENIKKQLNILQTREASYDLQDSQIQELRSILSKQDSEALNDKQAFDAKVAERLQLTQRLNKLEKKVKLLSTENAEIKNSLKVFSLENSKLENLLEIEKKSNQQLQAFTDGDETKFVDGLNAQLETLKDQVSELMREKDTLAQKVQSSDTGINIIQSNENSRELDTMEEDFDKQQGQKQDNWNMKMIQAKSMVLEERQNIEQEKKDIFERLTKISEEKEELSKQNENLLRDNSQSKVCYKTVEKQFKDAVKENDKLKKKQVEYEEKSKQLAELQEESENLQEQLKELEQLKKDKESLSKEKENQEKELADVKKSFVEMENQLIQVKKSASEAIIQSQQQQQQAAQIQEKSEQGQEVKVLDDPSRVSELQTELDEKIKMIHQLELQKQSYQNENAIFKSTYKRLEKQLRKSIKEKETFRKELEHEKLLFAEKTTGGDQRVLEVLKKEIKTLTEERDNLAKRNSKQDAKIKQLSQEANMTKMESEFDGEVKLQEKIEKAKSQVIEEKLLVEAEKSEIEKKLEDTVAAKNLLQIKSEAVLSENQAFHSNLTAMQKQLKLAIKERDAVILERNSLKLEIAEKDTQIEKINTELSRLEDKSSSKENNQLSTGGSNSRNQNEEDDDDEYDTSHSLLIQQKDKIIAEKDQIIEDMGRAKQQLDARASIAERELQAKAKEVERQQKELEELQTQLQDKMAVLAQKSQELEGTKNLEKFEEEFDEPDKGQSADVEEKLKEIVQQKSRVELENAGTKENYKALEKEFRRSLKACDELRKKMAESDEKLKELEDENGSLKETNEQLKQEKEQALTQLNEDKQVQPAEIKQNQSSEVSQISEDVRLKLEDLKLENQALLIEQNIQKKTNDRLENEINQLRDELKMQDMDQEFEEEIKPAASIIEEKDKVIDQLHKSTTVISQENTGLKSTFKSLEKELRRQVKECDEGKKAIKRLEGENQALAEKLDQYKAKFNIIDVEEGQESSAEASVVPGVSCNESVRQDISDGSAFQELQAKYASMVKEQEEFKLGLMLEFQEKEHQIEKTKSEIEQEKNDLERKANSITQEQSQQKLFYASLEKQFRRFIKDSEVLKKQVNVLQKFKGKVDEIVREIQQAASNGNESKQLLRNQAKESGDDDSGDSEDNVSLQYDILGWVRRQIAELVSGKKASEQAKEIEDSLRDQIKRIQRGSEEQGENAQRLVDSQAENTRLQREIEVLRSESENALKKAQRETSVVQQELNQVQQKLEKIMEEQLKRQAELEQERGKQQGQQSSKVAELKSEINKYQEQLKESIDRSQQDSERINELQKNIADLESDKQRYSGIVAERDRQLKDLQNSSSTLRQSSEQTEECRRLKQRVAEKEARVDEIEKKLTELVLRIDEQNKEISEQYNVIEVLQKKSSDIDETQGIIAELEVEKRICDQYREQCEIIKRKCDILAVANADLQGKQKNREDKQAAQLVQMKTLNAQLLKQNELLKDDRLAMIRDLEGLMMSKDQQQLQQQQLQQQQLGSASQTNSSSSSLQGMNQLRKPKSTTNITDEEMKNSSTNKQAKIKNKLYEFNQKVFDDVDPQLFSVEQDSIEQNDALLQGENDSPYGEKLARLEDEFHKEVQSLKQIIKSKESEIVQLKVKEQISLQQQNQQMYQQSNSQLLTPREKKQKQNSSPSRKAVPKLEQQNENNIMPNEHFTSTNEYGIERRSKNHSAQMQQQQQLLLQNEQLLLQQQSQIVQPSDAQRRHKLSAQQQQQHQQLLQLSTAAINQSASAVLERQRKSMPQMQFVTGFQHQQQQQQQQQLSKGLSNHTNSSNAGGGNSMSSSSNSTMNNINQNDMNSSNSNLNNNGSQSNKNISSSQLAQPVNPTAYSSRNINEGNSNNNTGNSNFLDQMYLKCIERSKNLLHKNETLLRSLKSPNLKAGAQTTATSILANQAQIQANQNQIHSAIQTASVAPVIKQPGMQAQQQLIISPSQSVHCPDGAESFTWRQPQSPQEQYFQNKQTQQQISSSPSSSSQQQQQYLPVVQQSSGQSQQYSNLLAIPSGGKQSNQASATSPMPQQTNMLSQISPIKLDYTKLLTPGQQQQQQPQKQQQQYQVVKNTTSSSSKSINPSQSPSSSSSQVPRYEGDLLGNLRDGAGCYFYTNGEIYEGEWKQDKRHGYGILKDEFGIDIYNGEWAYDKYDGQGRLRNRFMQISAENSSSKSNIIAGDYSNLDAIVRSWQFYSGEFKNNLMHGQGTLLLANNEKFMGQFENGKIHGEGSYYAQTGEVITAIWNDSRLASNTIIKSSPSPSNGGSNSNLRY